MENEKIKIDFFSEKNVADWQAAPSGINNQKKQIDIMQVAMKFMNEPKRLKKILIGIMLFLVVGFGSSLYFTIVYYDILIPIYVGILAGIYIYNKRKIVVDKIKNIFTKKDK